MHKPNALQRRQMKREHRSLFCALRVNCFLAGASISIFSFYPLRVYSLPIFPILFLGIPRKPEDRYHGLHVAVIEKEFRLFASLEVLTAEDAFCKPAVIPKVNKSSGYSSEHSGRLQRGEMLYCCINLVCVDGCAAPTEDGPTIDTLFCAVVGACKAFIIIMSLDKIPISLVSVLAFWTWAGRCLLCCPCQSGDGYHMHPRSDDFRTTPQNQLSVENKPTTLFCQRKPWGVLSIFGNSIPRFFCHRGGQSSWEKNAYSNSREDPGKGAFGSRSLSGWKDD